MVRSGYKQEPALKECGELTVANRRRSDPRDQRSCAGSHQKLSDEFTVPLCRAHHRELHRAGKEVVVV